MPGAMSIKARYMDPGESGYRVKDAKAFIDDARKALEGTRGPLAVDFSGGLTFVSGPKLTLGQIEPSEAETKLRRLGVLGKTRCKDIAQTTLSRPLPKLPPSDAPEYAEAKEEQGYVGKARMAFQIELELQSLGVAALNHQAGDICKAGAFVGSKYYLARSTRYAAAYMVCFRDCKGVLRTNYQNQAGKDSHRGYTVESRPERSEFTGTGYVKNGKMWLSGHYVPLSKPMLRALESTFNKDEIDAGEHLASHPDKTLDDLMTRINEGPIFGPATVRKVFVDLQEQLSNPLINQAAFGLAVKLVEDLILRTIMAPEKIPHRHGYKISLHASSLQTLHEVWKNGTRKNFPVSYIEEIFRCKPRDTLAEEVEFRAILLRVLERAALNASERIDSRIDKHNQHVAFWVKLSVAIITAGLGAVPVPGIGAVGAALGPVGDLVISKHDKKHPKNIVASEMNADIQRVLDRASEGLIVPGLPPVDVNNYPNFKKTSVGALIAEERAEWGKYFCARYHAFKSLAGKPAAQSIANP